jgi:peptidyl-prolyl cis-trans isomerase D
LPDRRSLFPEGCRAGHIRREQFWIAELRRQFKPEDGKPFDQKRYEQNIVEQFGSISAFEEGVRDDLSGNRLRAFVTSGVTVTEEEVLRDFQRRNTKFDLSYVLLSPSELAKSITPTEEELRDYFERNKQAYYISVPQKKIRYVFLKTSKVGDRLSISDDDLKAEYDKLPEDKKIAGVLGREIVLRVAKPEFDGQVFEKATSIIQRLRKDGEKVSEDVFAELARGQSEVGSASRGGSLPGPVRENPNNPDDPYQRLLAMQPGQVSEPISYQGRYFILWRGDAVPKPFADARRELEVSLRNRRAYAENAELAKRVAAALKENRDVEATAKAFASEANMSTSEMVRETAYIKPGDNVEFIGVSPQFEEGIASLEQPNDVGDEVPVPDGFAVPLLVDRKEPRDAEFAEVRDRLVEVVRLEKARAEIESIARQIASGAGSPSALAAAAQARGQKAQDSKSFILGSPLGEGPSATTSGQLEDAIFALRPGEVTKEPIKIGENYYIVGVSSREEANMEDFARQRDSLMDQMLNRKQGDVFFDYLNAVRRRMETAGQIRIIDEAVARIDAADSGLPFSLPNM